MYKTDRIAVVTGIIVTILAFGAAFALAGSAVTEILTDPTTDEPLVAHEARGKPGQSDEQSETPVIENITNPIYINLTLTWMDEGDATNRHTNAPDQFGLLLEGPGGLGDEVSYVSNTHGQQGEVTLNYKVPREAKAWDTGTGDWTIIVRCGDCGDHRPMISLIGFRDRADTGNSWELAIDIMYYEFEDTGSEE